MVESVSTTLLNITLSLTFFIMAVLMSRGYHITCNNGWVVAILKAIGLQILSGIFLIAIAGPMFYWDKTSRQRAAQKGQPDKPTVIGKIGHAIAPWSMSGMAVQVVLTFALYKYFTSDC